MNYQLKIFIIIPVISTTNILKLKFEKINIIIICSYIMFGKHYGRIFLILYLRQNIFGIFKHAF